METRLVKHQVFLKNGHVVVVEAHLCRVNRDGMLEFMDVDETVGRNVTTFMFADGAWSYFEICKKATDDEG